MFNTLKVLRLPAGVQYDEDCDYYDGDEYAEIRTSSRCPV